MALDAEVRSLFSSGFAEDVVLGVRLRVVEYRRRGDAVGFVRAVREVFGVLPRRFRLLFLSEVGEFVLYGSRLEVGSWRVVWPFFEELLLSRFVSVSLGVRACASR